MPTILGQCSLCSCFPTYLSLRANALQGKIASKLHPSNTRVQYWFLLLLFTSVCLAANPATFYSSESDRTFAGLQPSPRATEARSLPVSLCECKLSTIPSYQRSPFRLPPCFLLHYDFPDISRPTIYYRLSECTACRTWHAPSVQQTRGQKVLCLRVCPLIKHELIRSQEPEIEKRKPPEAGLPSP